MIEGLTDGKAAFPVIGKIRKGAPKYTEKKEDGREVQRIGKDLDYFRIDTKDEVAAGILRGAFGEKPQHLRVYLQYATAEENFDPFREEWKAGGLVHRCTGKTMVLYRKNGTYCDTPAPCPYKDKPEKEKLCKPVGRLPVVFRELQRAVSFLVQTTSKNDCITLSRSLKAAELEARANGRDLIGVPMILSRQLTSVSSPGEGDKRVRRDKWLMFIEIESEWWGRRLAHVEMQALPPAPDEIEGDPDEDAGDDGAEAEYEMVTVKPVASKKQQTPAEKAAALEDPGSDGEDDEEEARPPGSANPGQIAAIKKLCADRKQDPEAVCKEFAGVGLGLVGEIAAGELITELQRHAGNGNGKNEQKPAESKPEEEPLTKDALIRKINGVVDDLHAAGKGQKEIGAVAKKCGITDLTTAGEDKLARYWETLKALKGSADKQVPVTA